MANTDSEDELKRQMRRRLVGAVALVTALVIILPMLLESSPDPRAGSLELRIPDKDRAGAFTSQMVVAESAPEIIPEPSSMPQETTQAQAESMPAAATPTQAKPATAKTVKPAPEKTVKPEPAHKPAGPEHKTEEPKAGFAVQVGAFSHSDSAKELLEKLRKQGWHAYTEKAGETIRVRVGPYSSRVAAEQALHKLEAQGLQPAIVGEP